MEKNKIDNLNFYRISKGLLTVYYPKVKTGIVFFL